MNDTQHKATITNALNRFTDGDLAENARNLLNTLGYRSERVLALEPNTADAFIGTFDPQEKLNRDRALIAEWVSVAPLFQLRGVDLTITDTDGWLFDPSQTHVDNTIIKSYVFLALRLHGSNYNRTQLSQITREINKLFPMPVMLLFQHGNTLTLSVINRRLGVRDQSRDVLEKVTLIKDINFSDTHRAHIDILFDLALEPLNQTHGVHNFVELHRAWEKTLDTEELNKKFYRELFAWFEWAVKEADFPTDEKRILKPEEHVIRLITRLLFVWFIKEKGLIADELFNETHVRDLLEDYNRDTGDSYYRAVLQNLFFGTLNTEIEKRQFSKKGSSGHRNFSRYRYEDQMRDPDTLLALFAQTPFINGGLFDCLDSFKAPRDGGYRIDCFSDKDYEKLSIPNRLFFDDSRGLIPLLTHYKFTVEENTPIEQEVALDPELLGKVFENLLAAYNPETGATVRKQTGSYYTPRAIVDYMVEEALVATLAGQVPPTDGDTELWKEELRYLFDYAQVCDDASEWFSDDETDGIVRAISELKILDPAVGSGAFPMGVLHKLTLALRRLDPDNSRWKQLQQDRAGKRAQAAFEISNQQERDVELAEISDTFERYRDSDFGRKLYLIRSSIFGVDIQPIACQIAKLRFFISLAIEQEPDGDANNNFGIKPLPNLETRFVAANTLIGLQLSEALPLLQDDTVRQLLEEIEGIREKHFLANNRQQKLDLEEREDECRELLRGELEIQGTKWVENRKQEIEQKITQLSNPKYREQLREVEQKKYEGRKKEFDSGFEDAHKIAGWKPYDQNAKADWFDPEWMFGIKSRFDVVIGNPPYGLLNKRQNKKMGHLASPEEIQYYKTSSEYTPAMGGMINVFRLFIVKSVHLLNDGGIFSQIFPLAFIGDVSSSNLRKYLLQNYKILNIEAFPERDNAKKRVFEAVKMSVCILNLHSQKSTDKFFLRIHSDRFVNIENEKVILDIEDISLIDKANYAIPLLRERDLNLIRKIYWKSSVRMVDLGHCYTGEIDLTANKKYLTDDSECAVMIKGAIIDKYLIRQSMSQGEVKFLNSKRYLQENQGAKSQHHKNDRIVLQAITGVNERIRLKMTLIEKGIFCANSVNYLVFKNNAVNTKYILALLNSSTLNFVFSKSSTNSNVNGYEIDNLPIVLADKQHQTRLASLVDQILTAKNANPDRDVSELENEIDQIVYSSYGLTDDEIKIVEEA